MKRPQATRLPPAAKLWDLTWSAAALIGVALLAYGIRTGAISWI